MVKQKGVTLIELLIAIAVIGILTSIAYPSYQHHLQKSHRTQAMADMIKIQLTLEESYTQSSNYDYSIISGGTCSFCESDINRYKLDIDSSGTGMNTYIIKAAPKSGTVQADDNCGTLSLNAAGIGEAKKDGKLVSGCW